MRSLIDKQEPNLISKQEHLEYKTHCILPTPMSGSPTALPNMFYFTCPRLGWR